VKYDMSSQGGILHAGWIKAMKIRRRTMHIYGVMSFVINLLHNTCDNAITSSP
jgi:hypothetical protein